MRANICQIKYASHCICFRLIIPLLARAAPMMHYLAIARGTKVAARQPRCPGVTYLHTKLKCFTRPTVDGSYRFEPHHFLLTSSFSCTVIAFAPAASSLSRESSPVTLVYRLYSWINSLQQTNGRRLSLKRASVDRRHVYLVPTLSPPGLPPFLPSMRLSWSMAG